MALVMVVALVWGMSQRNDASRLRRGQRAMANHGTMDTREALDTHGITPKDNSQASNKPETADQLAYMIEEEKLAHDIYQALYEKWGARVFGNIQHSETMHQNMVLAVMQSRGLADPRSSEFGKFTNNELQQLYDQLLARGYQSIDEAYRVGVAVEERDIADLRQTLANLDAKDSDVKAVLETLLRGSENHLRAFNRQLSR